MKYLIYLTASLTAGLSLSAIAPAIGQDANSPSPAESTTTNSNSQTIKGTIKSIVGQLVIVELASGGTTTLSLSKDQIGRYNLRPGMYVSATQTNGVAVIESVSYSATSTSDSATSNRILNLKPPAVRMETSTETTGSSDTTTNYSDSTTSEGNSATTPVETPPATLPATPRALW